MVNSVQQKRMVNSDLESPNMEKMQMFLAHHWRRSNQGHTISKKNKNWLAIDSACDVKEKNEPTIRDII